MKNSNAWLAITVVYYEFRAIGVCGFAALVLFGYLNLTPNAGIIDTGGMLSWLIYGPVYVAAGLVSVAVAAIVLVFTLLIFCSLRTRYPEKANADGKRRSTQK